MPGEGESAFVQVVDDEGRVIASTENIDGVPAISTRLPESDDQLVMSITVPRLDDAESVRVVAVNATTGIGTVTVDAGENLDGAEAITGTISGVLAIGLPILLAVVAAVTWWSVGRTLKPVRDITATLADITPTDLHQRVQAPPTRDEIGQLARTVNDTLTRLEGAVDEQRRLVADASHELRGPIAALRADLEISIDHPEHTPWRDVARDVLGDVDRLQHLAEDLLLLARLDADTQRAHRPVDLAAIAAGSVLDVRRSDITVISTGVGTPAPVSGDRDQLTRMVRNLVHNAEQHAPTRITIDVTARHDGTRLRVADDGPGIPASQREHVFERFVRLDTARTRDSGGTGLGLAIVRDVVTTHNGTVTITDSAPHGTIVTVHLPALVTLDPIDARVGREPGAPRSEP